MKAAVPPAACAALLLSFGSAARAGGVFIPGAGPHAQARAGAFVARADDPTALGHNPAGLARLPGTQISIGANFIDYDIAFRRAGSYEPTGEATPESYEGQPYPEVSDQSRPSLGIGEFQLVPTFALSTDLGRPHWPVRFAIGVITPHGFSRREFPVAHDLGDGGSPAPGPQRYDVIEQELVALLPSVAVAYSPLPQLDVGVRLSWGIATARGKRAVWAIRNYEEYEGRDSVFTLERATDPFVPSFGAGALYRPLSSLEIGIAYASALHVRSRGTGSTVVGDAVGIDDGARTVPVADEFARCAPGGSDDALKICIAGDVPQTATAGARWIFRDATGREQGDIELDVAWEDWSASSETETVVDAMDSIGQFLNPTVTRHGFRDAYSFRLGGSWAVPVAAQRLIARAGAAWDTAAAPDRFTRLDLDGKARATLAGGVGWETRRFRIDLGAGLVIEPDVSIEPCKPPGGPSVDDPGCGGTGETPVADRTAPDPLQPKQGALNQVENPVNAGVYESGYVLFSVGFTTWF